MRFTKDEMSEMTRKKQNSPKTVDHLVMDELLEMGFTYTYIGTHYLHDSITCATKLRIEDFNDANDFFRTVNSIVRGKYKVGKDSYGESIASAINRAFETGNVGYLLDVFKGVYNKDKMTVSSKNFIMVVRKKIIETLEEQKFYNTTQLRLIIQGSVERITDYNILKGICDIILSVGNKTFA